jgi:hypothetical protein
MFQKAAPAGDGGRRAFRYVFFEELLGGLVYIFGSVRIPSSEPGNVPPEPY